jgi:AraC family transcriptional activator of pobA
LKQLTGQTTQQIIHNKMVERAKDLLSTTGLTIMRLPFSWDLSSGNLSASYSKAKAASRLWRSGNHSISR